MLSIVLYINMHAGCYTSNYSVINNKNGGGHSAKVVGGTGYVGFRTMQSVSNTSTQREAHTAPSDTSVDSSIAAFATETTHDAKGVGENLSSNSDKPSSPDVSMQSSSVENLDPSRDQRNAETLE